MSYILDALRKSDQQRQRGVPPTLLAPQATAVEPRRRLSASHVVLTAALVGAGIVIGALRPWQTEPPALMTKSAATSPLESNLRASSVPMQPRMARKSEQEAPAQRIAPPIPSAAVLTPATTERRVPAEQEPQHAARTHNAPPQTNKAIPQETGTAHAMPQGPATGSAAPEHKVLTMAELPLSIRQELPTLSISVHAYSRETKDRLIGINDRVLREGDYLAPGLRLEEITRDGMVLRYKGYRFLRGVR